MAPSVESENNAAKQELWTRPAIAKRARAAGPVSTTVPVGVVGEDCGFGWICAGSLAADVALLATRRFTRRANSPGGAG